jgi:exodeoxyribonuclease VIII
MGIIHGMTEAEYHTRPELSSTGARLLLDSTAKFRYRQTHPGPQKDAFDLGTAVHAKVLGVDERVIEYPAEHLTPAGNASTKKETIEWVQEQRAKGLVVISASQAALVDGMAEAVLAHPTARAILEQPGNQRELSMFATDPDTGVDMRARLDLDGKRTSADLKTARDASPKGFARAAADHGYDTQQGWYQDVREQVTGDRGRFQFIVVETLPPHLVAVYELDYTFEDMGKIKSAAARTIYRECVDTNTWPGYAPNVKQLQPPQYAIYDYMDAFEAEEPMKVSQ